MKRILEGSFLSAALFAAACSAAYADKPAPAARVAVATHDQALAIAPEAQRALYNVNIVADDGSELPMFAKGGRYYVLGSSGDRYVVHVSNPTSRRIEAVVSVDGLDVIDGDAGDLHKRGYVIQPYGELNVDGFRTSTTDVATFRFSSVGDSYAERKGKGRNVGVIAVAIFEEQAPPQIVEPAPPAPPEYDYRRDLDDEDGEPDTGASAPRPTTTAHRPTASNQATRGAGGGASTHGDNAKDAPPPAPRTASAGDDTAPGAAEGSGSYQPPADKAPSRERLGLGTEFGESRYSSVSYTKFVRASAKPAAVAELRYNDAAGLTALGIPVQPMPDDNELGTRETANPFPGDDHFARPPGGR